MVTQPSATLPTPFIDDPIDDPIEWPVFGRVLDGTGGSRWESFVSVDAVYCAACAITIENALKPIVGVESTSVSVAGRKARVTWNADLTQPSVWLQALAQAGYPARPVADVRNETGRRADTRKALWRWMVAGLCMMQVMMYAYPSYVADRQEMGADAQYLMRWASWLISLPVVLFSSASFFDKALRDLRHARVGMDLPVSIGILITFLVSTAGTFDPLGTFGHEVYFDSLTMFVFFLLSGRLLELKLRDRVFFAMDSAFHKMPQSVQRQKADGSLEVISAKRVVQGDVLWVPNGEAFVADGLVLSGHSHVNESVLTGESQSVAKSPGDRVIAGSINTGTAVTVQVERVGHQTRLGEIMALMATAQTTRPSVAGLADRLAKPFLLVVLLVAGLTALFWWSTDPERGLMAAVAVLIVTCPCALSLATPSALLVSVGRLAKEGVLVKRLEALELLSHIDTVVFDKTGTLTQDAMAVCKVEHRDGVSQARAVAIGSALAQHSAHPLSRSLVQFSKQVQRLDADASSVQLTSVKETIGFGVSGLLHDPATQAKTSARLGSANFCEVQAQACANSVVYLADEMGWLASFEFDQLLRDDALQTVRWLQSSGKDVRILSGDNTLATASVAQALGVVHAWGDLSPAHKLQHIQTLQEQGHQVAMVGDGINDALVLAAANVSVSLGSAVPLAQNQCDVLIQSSALFDLHKTYQQALLTVAVIRQNLAWALAYNVVAVPMAVMGLLPAWAAGLGMALSSLLVVANAGRLARLDH